MKTDYDILYERKLREYKGLIKFASRRYEIKGVLDPGDLYQEGCLILEEMIAEGEFDVDSTDFSKMFKTRLWHGLWKHLQYHKADKRDHRKVVAIDPTLASDESNYSLVQRADDGGQDSLSINMSAAPEAPRPPQADEHRIEYDQAAKVEKFIELLYQRLDYDARQILYEMLYPRDWSEIPSEFHTTSGGYTFWRKPRKIPQHALANAMGWPLIRVRRAIKRVRTTAKSLGEELHIEGIERISLQKRKRRKVIQEVVEDESAQSIPGQSVLYAGADLLCRSA